MTSEAPIEAFILVELPELMLDSPKYTKAQNQLAKAEGAIKTVKGMVGIVRWQIIGTRGAGTHSGKPNTPSDPCRP